MIFIIRRIRILRKKIVVFLSDLLYKGYERLLTKEVLEDRIPEHAAIIMDGNRRYAEVMGELAYMGHHYGANATKKMLQWCGELGIKRVTIYAFSTENFNRTEEEKQHLFDLMKENFEKYSKDKDVEEHKVGVRVIGDVDLLPEELIEAIKDAERSTKDYNEYSLYIALAYGGRREIVDAARKIAKKVKSGELKSEDVTKDVIASNLYSKPINTVDLLIRTGGEIRTSNFLPWQASGNECATYFCTSFWPEIRKIDLLRAIRTYQKGEVKRRRSVVLRAIRLLRECGILEVEEVIELSKRVIGTTREEVISIIDDLMDELHLGPEIKKNR
jgi:tritrans,polycis-undecaprenyl-diphosphate synthase [geranylgeranyl-diphosphate specific]